MDVFGGMANSTKIGLKGSFSVTYIEAEETFRPKLIWHGKFSNVGLKGSFSVTYMYIEAGETFWTKNTKFG